uniref:superoxide dismutase n=1 Tax=Oryza glumipatula TaxID=40148 RepID=A0A0E0A4U8_9ORYZ
MAAFASALRVLPSPLAAVPRRLRSLVILYGGCSAFVSNFSSPSFLRTGLYRWWVYVVSYNLIVVRQDRFSMLLVFTTDALEPYISKRTVELHWGKHQQDYVDSLNKQLATSMFYGYTLEELIKEAYNNGNPLPEYNNAAQVWNHHFFWESMQPEGGGSPGRGVLQQIEKDFGSFTNFREEFIRSALSLLGSGWVWLVLKRKERKFSVVHTQNAISPLALGDINNSIPSINLCDDIPCPLLLQPLINLDLWEHAYYLDYKDDRRMYVTNFIDHLVSWDTVTLRMMRAEAFVNLGEPNIPVA